MQDAFLCLVGMYLSIGALVAFPTATYAFFCHDYTFLESVALFWVAVVLWPGVFSA